MTMPSGGVRRDEQGMVLIGVILLLMTMSALCAALAVSGNTETFIARNHQTAAQSRAAAEAGLNHAVAVTIANVQNWQANGLASASAAMSALLLGPDGVSGTSANDADNGSLANLGIPLAGLTLAGLPGITYEARLLDEDDATRGLGPADIITIGENTNAVSDANNRIVVRAIGRASGNAVATIEATIGPLQLPAVVTNQNLTINGGANLNILGTEGGAHSNANLTISGSPDIQQDATASGSFSAPVGWAPVSGTAGGGYANTTVPPIQPSEHLSKADFILTDQGTVTNQAGTVLCDASSDDDACEPAYGWTYEGNGTSCPSNACWRIQTNGAVAAGTYYVEGDARIAQAPALVNISIIAEGDVRVDANTALDPDYPGLLFVAGEDVDISGTVSAVVEEAQILVREQVSLSGNFTLTGQVLAEGAASVSNLVTSNSISGSVTITYNGTINSVFFTVTAWRRVP